MSETAEHYSGDGYPVKVGAHFWNNDMRVAEITEVAAHSNAYADTGEIQTWHQTQAGQFDTLSGTMRKWGRLYRYVEGKNAENYPAGTNYRDVK